MRNREETPPEGEAVGCGRGAGAAAGGRVVGSGWGAGKDAGAEGAR